MEVDKVMREVLTSVEARSISVVHALAPWLLQQLDACAGFQNLWGQNPNAFACERVF